MGLSIVKVTAGGLPVTITSTGGLPCTEATNGRGIAVTQSTIAGGGLAVTGFTFGPDVTAPTITSSNSVSNPENTVLAHTLTANEPVTWAIVAGGADNARFELSGSTLRWLSNGMKDFEAPNDADANNAYIVTVRATDLASNPSTTQTITVTVTNVISGGLPAPVAPVLTLTSATTDLTPDFTLTGDLVLNDTVRFQYSTASDFTGAAELTNTIDAGEDAANSISFTTGTLAVNTWYFRARIERPEYTFSDWSNVVTVTLTSSGTSAEVAQFLARSSSLDGTHTAAYTALIDGLVADGIWAKLDALYIFATQSTANALLNLKSSSYTATAVGSLSFAADDGYNANLVVGGDDYVNTGLNATTSGGNYTQNSAHMMCWVHTDDATLSGGGVVGTLSGSTRQYILPHYAFSTTAYFRINTNDGTSATVTSAAGMTLANRSSSSAIQGYKNGASVATDNADTSVALNNSNFTFPDMGTLPDEAFIVSAGSFGGSLTSTEAGNFYTRMRAYMTAVGVP